MARPFLCALAVATAMLVVDGSIVGDDSGLLSKGSMSVEVDAQANMLDDRLQRSDAVRAALVRREATTKEHRQTTISTVVPDLVFFTGPWEPAAVVAANKHMIKDGTEFRYFDDHAMARSAYNLSQVLLQENVLGAWDAFKSLRPGAYRADLWRYMYLWANGGIYFDAKIKMDVPANEWLTRTQDRLVICGDSSYFDHVWTGILAAPPRNAVLLQIIKEVIQNVKGRFYGTGWRADLEITGPGIVTKVLKESNASYSEACSLQPPKIVKSPEKSQVVAELDESIHNSMREAHGANTDYSALHKHHQVYCEEYGPPCPSYDEAALASFVEAGDPTDKGYWSYVAS